MSDPADQVIALYRRHARAWFDQRGMAGIERKWLDAFFATMPLQRRVLDLGCGAGLPNAGYLMSRGCRVTGVDTAPELLDIAQAHIPQGEWIEADMRGLRLERAFDGILAWHSMFHLSPDDQRAMFPLFQAHSLPGTALLFTSGPGKGTAHSTLEGDTLYHASLSQDEYRALLDGHGFDLVDQITRDPDCGDATVWLARQRG